MSALVQAIEAYDSAYGRFPVSQAAQGQANENAAQHKNPDFTYGGNFPTPSGTLLPLGTTGHVVADPLTNNEVIAILMDYTNYPGNPTQFTVNTNHQKNPQQTKFLNAKMVSDVKLGGVGPDLVYRDPWGNPYVITMDLNYDEQCNDWFYGKSLVSQQRTGGATGFCGLYNNVDTTGKSDDFQYHGKVMVWSAGPYPGKNSGVDDKAPANGPVNKNHVLSWQ
jgi:hypothetical protein